MNYNSPKQIIKHLQDLINRRVTGSGFIKYELECGDCFGFNLLYEENCSIQKAYMSKDSFFPQHEHTSKEILIVIDGEVKVHKFGSESVVLKVGDTIEINPGEIHTVHSLKDTWMIGISIPREEGYPSG